MKMLEIIKKLSYEKITATRVVYCVLGSSTCHYNSKFLQAANQRTATTPHKLASPALYATAYIFLAAIVFPSLLPRSSRARSRHVQPYSARPAEQLPFYTLSYQLWQGQVRESAYHVCECSSQQT